jgi:hypothetical protein
MANNEKVTYNDLFDKDVLAGIEKLQGATNVLYDDFKKIALASKEYGISSKDFVKSNTEASKASYEASKMIRQQEADRKKLIAASEKEARAMEKLTVAYQLQVKQQQEEINKAKTLASVLAAEAGSRQRSAAIISLLEGKIKSLNLATVDGQKKLEVWNKTIDVHNNKLKTTGSNLDQQRRNVGNYTGQWNALGNSVAQLSRELPNFAMSARIGFMAISNNLPAFSDAIRDINAQNKILAAEGKATTSVWKQLGSSIFGWQTILTIGITLMVAYGESFVTFVANLIDGSEDLKKKQEEFAEWDKKAQSEIADNRSKSYALIAENKKKEIELLKIRGKEIEALLLEKNEIKAIKTAAEEKKKAQEDNLKTVDKQLESFRKRVSTFQLAKEAQAKYDADMANISTFSMSIAEIDAEQKRITNEFNAKKKEFGYAKNKKIDTASLEEIRIGITKLKTEQTAYYSAIKVQEDIIAQAEYDLAISSENQKKVKSKKEIDANLKAFEVKKQYELSRFNLLDASKIEMLRREQYWDKIILDYRKKNNIINEEQYLTGINNMKAEYDRIMNNDTSVIKNRVGQEFRKGTTTIKAQISKQNYSGYGAYKSEEDYAGREEQTLLQQLGLNDDDIANIKTGYDQIYDLASEHQQKMVDLAKQKSDKADKEVDNARENLNSLRQLQAQGYNADITQAQKDLELAKQGQKKADEIEQKALKRQRALQAVQQAGNLATASSDILSKNGSNPYVYIPLLALMWGTWAASLVKSKQVTKEYALGGEINVGGGTHAEGRDTYIGTHNGKDSYAQKGEKLAIFNDKAVSHYGSDLSKLIKGVNNKSIKLAMSNGGNSIIQFSTHGMESRLDKIYKQNEEKIYIAGNKMIIKKGSVTKIKNIS